ncbi:MAG: ABC transporter substrate-binding protein, partial [Actinomycetota bacterium]|nr:ABC transporter substrate-binding protein [Actinomycetota bacterium]
MLAAAAFAGCGADAGGAQPPGARTLTVYASLPLSGPHGRTGRDVLDAMKLALAEAQGRAGPFRMELLAFDDADPATGAPDDDRVLGNARAAVADRDAVALIGGLNSGAVALALPLLNEGGLLHVAPTAGYPGLTRRVPGGRGEPASFYPSGLRTFGRLVPHGGVQAAAQAGWLARRGVRRLHVAHDGGLAGRTLAELVARAAAGRGIRIAAAERAEAA